MEPSFSLWTAVSIVAAAAPSPQLTATRTRTLWLVTFLVTNCPWGSGWRNVSFLCGCPGLRCHDDVSGGGARRIIDGKQRRTSRPAARDTFFRVSVFCVDLQLENGGPRRTASSPLGDFVSYLIKSWIVVDYLKRRRGLLVTCAMHTSACAYYSSIHYELS